MEDEETANKELKTNNSSKAVLRLPCAVQHPVETVSSSISGNFAVFLYSYNNNKIYLLQMGCHPVAVIILHVFPNTTDKFT
jgi:hypothetical protein